MKKLLKKSLALILALICAMSLGVTSFAMTDIAMPTSGTCGAEGKNLKWSYDAETSTLTIKGNGKICIAQTVTKGECGVDAETVKVAVTCIDTLFVVFVFKIAIEITVIPGKGDVIVLYCPGVGKLSGRRDRTA